jgi:actin-related protein 3
MEKPVVIFDNGSGYSKIGLAGNQKPDYIIPSAISSREATGVPVSRNQCDDLDYFIGDEAFRNQRTHNLSFPVREGQVNNWDEMERYWQRSIYSLMHVEPQEHVFLLTEPPMNPPENREQMAEIMFETFDVAGLYIGVQAVLALFGCKQGSTLTGTVIDSGDGVTHIIPIAHGYVISSCIKHIPIAGRDITKYIVKSLRDRREQIPPEDLMDASREIKEQFCYVCRNMDSEVKHYNDPGSEKFRLYEGKGKTTGTPLRIQVGTERFLGPEVFFSPGKLTKDWDRPLDECVDSTIQSCPIDLRRDLYSNIVLSGGTTLFKNFHKRLGDELQVRVDDRLRRYKEAYGKEPAPITCKINSPGTQRYAVWYGASIFASSDAFKNVYHSREQYLEHGPSIARRNVVFGAA